MSDTTAGLLQVGLLIAALTACYCPLGAYMAWVYTSGNDSRVERVLYRVMGVDPQADQRWPVYARSLLAFSAVSVLGLFALLRLQPHLPLSLGFPGVAPDQAFNTAASFVTNTNWQSYSGESTIGHLAQMAGLAVQNFASAAVGIAVAVALIRGFTRSRTDRVGNFWVDLTRGCLRILLPLAIVGTIALGRARRGAELLVRNRRHHPGRHPPEHHRRAGCLPGGHQGAGHPRWRLLQHDPLSSSASNLGPENKDLITAIGQRRTAAAKLDGIDPKDVAPDALLASGSGLDPQISPAYAAEQVARIARERGLHETQVQALVAAHTEGRTLGFLGEPRVNVLELNLALDAALRG